MNTFMSENQFIKLRDQGKFSKKSEGKHSYYLYFSEKKYRIKDKKVKENNGNFINKYFHSSNIPNKYNIQLIK